MKKRYSSRRHWQDGDNYAKGVTKKETFFSYSKHHIFSMRPARQEVVQLVELQGQADSLHCSKAELAANV